MADHRNMLDSHSFVAQPNIKICHVIATGTALTRLRDFNLHGNTALDLGSDRKSLSQGTVVVI